MTDRSTSSARCAAISQLPTPDADDILAAFMKPEASRGQTGLADAQARLIGVFEDVDAFINEQLEQHGWQLELDRMLAQPFLNEFLHFDHLALERRLRAVYKIVSFKRWVFVFQR